MGSVFLSGDAARALLIAWDDNIAHLKQDPDSDPAVKALMLRADSYLFIVEELEKNVRVIIRPNPKRLEIEGGGTKYLVRKNDFSVSERELEK